MGRISFKTSIEAIFGFVWDFVRVVVLCLVLNPIVWWLWALIAPKSAVGLLRDTTKHNRKLFKLIGGFWFCFDCWAIKILPWRSQRFFYKGNIGLMNDKQRVRAYCEGWLKKDNLSQEAISILWKQSGIYWNDLADRQLSLEQFADLLNYEYLEELKLHLNRTPSNAKMEALLRSVSEKNNPLFRPIVFNTIAKYGLSSELVKTVFTSAEYINIREDVEKALDVYNEVETVKSLSSDNERWFRFLRTLSGGRLSVQAQNVLTKDQFSSYVQNGKSFDEELLWDWMNNTFKREWVASYVERQLQLGMISSEPIKNLIKTDPWWRKKIKINKR